MIIDRYRMKHRISQAVVETALFGTLIISLFGTALYYLQGMNDGQMTAMESFRRALYEANHNNAVVTYTIFDDKRNVDLNSPLKGSHGQVSDSASVYWAVPSVGKAPEQLGYYKINEYAFEYKPADFKVDDISIDHFEEATDTGSKKESGGNVTNKDDTVVDSRVKYVFKDKDGNTIKEVQQVLENDGKYRNDNRSIGFKESVSSEERPYRRGRQWQTQY